MYLKTKIVEIAEKVQDVYKKLDSRILSLGNSTGSIAPMISIKNSSSDSLVQEKSGANTETVIDEQMRGTKRKSNSMDNEGASDKLEDNSDIMSSSKGKRGRKKNAINSRLGKLKDHMEQT